MQSLISIFLRFGHIFLFIVLEFFCFYLIVTYNGKQREIWANSSNLFMGIAAEKWNDWTNYFSLQDKMDDLAAENALLKQKLISYGLRPSIIQDSILIQHQQYEVIPAKVVHATTNRPNNYLTINRGFQDGVRKGMGVVTNNGIIGIVNNVSDQYATVITLLHRRVLISAAIQRTGAFGMLRWLNNDAQYASLTAIENHHSVELGDTIITTGYATHFPRGIMIGTVSETNLPSGSNSYDIKIKLSEDFSSLLYVLVLKNKHQQEQFKLEKENINE